MTTLSPQQQIDLAAEQQRLMLAPFARSQQDMDNMIGWAKHNAKAYEAWLRNTDGIVPCRLKQEELGHFHKPLTITPSSLPRPLI